MDHPPSPLDTPLPISPSGAWLETEYARTLAYLEKVSAVGTAEFNEEKILEAIDRLKQIERAMPPEMSARYADKADPDDVPF